MEGAEAYESNAWDFQIPAPSLRGLRVRMQRGGMTGYPMSAAQTMS